MLGLDGRLAALDGGLIEGRWWSRFQSKHRRAERGWRVRNFFHHTPMFAHTALASGRRAFSRTVSVARPVRPLRAVGASPATWSHISAPRAKCYSTSLADVNPDEDAVRGSQATASSPPGPTPAAPTTTPKPSFTEGFSPASTADVSGEDWTRSFHGLSTQPFSKETAEILQAPIDPLDLEMKPGK